MDAEHQNVIFRKYGDSLYQKGEYDNAMQQYLKAIDNTEPSQVIRKVKFHCLAQIFLLMYLVPRFPANT